MSFVPAICTQCGAVLEVDDSLEAAICKYCGTPFIVEKAINTYTINNTISADTVNVQGLDKEFDILGGVLNKYLGSIEEINIPENVYEIAESCFEGTYIRRVTLNKNLRLFGKRAFANCRNLEEVDTSLCQKFESAPLSLT